MHAGSLQDVIQHLRQPGLAGDSWDETDGQLLGGYIEHRDPASFAALVKRHAAMVWGVCRRTLSDHHEAEDAFQATFLVLVRRARSIVPREMVGNWLYGVARQTAMKARSNAARRRIRETHMDAMPQPARHPDVTEDLHELLDSELSRLPDKFRAAIVLCELEGRTRKEAARQLGCPEGTVASRLATAKAMLAKRLARQGFVVSGTALATAMSSSTFARVPEPVVSAAIELAGRTAVSPVVAALTQEVLKAMLLNTLKPIVVIVLLALGLAAAGGGVGAFQADAEQPAAEQTELDGRSVNGHNGGVVLFVMKRDKDKPAQPPAESGKTAGSEGLLKEMIPNWPADAPIQLQCRMADALARPEAIAKAREYLGIDKSAEGRAAPAFLTDRDFPFVKVEKRPIWLVQFKEVFGRSWTELRPVSWSQLFIAIDADCGNPIEIFTSAVGTWWREPAQLVGKKHEERLDSHGIHFDSPTKPPKVAVIESWKGLVDKPCAQFITRYVLYSKTETIKAPAYFITREGLEDFTASKFVGRAMRIVDANTGTLLREETYWYPWRR